MKLTLDKICTAIVDCEHKTAPVDEAGEYFAVGTPAMRGNTIEYSQARRISKDTFEQWTRRLTPKTGDLLFAREAPVGPIVLIPDTENVAPGQRTVLIRPDSEIADSRFLYYLLSSPLQQNLIQSLAAGSTVAHLNVSDIRSLELDIPSLEIQRSVAEVLGALDDKIAANTHQARLAEELAGNLFDRAVAPLPLQPMSTILSPILGGTPSRSNLEFWNGEDLWASARDITGAPFSVVLDTEEKITSTAVERTKAKPLPAGSVILTARGTVGAVARLGAPASFNQSCYGFLPEGIPPSLLYFSVLRATDQAKALVHGSVFDTITKRTFDHLLIPEFGDAVNSLESKLSPLLDLVTACVHESKTLAATRDALLPQLMSGKLRVKDAEKVVEKTL